MIDFPSNPTNGQVYGNWIYDSSITAWRNVNTDTGIGTLNAMGLKNVVPTSINVASGSATVNANGTVTFTGVTSISLNNVFSSAYAKYRVMYTDNGGGGAQTVIYMRMRSSGSDNSNSLYFLAGNYATHTGGSGTRSFGSATSWWFHESSGVSGTQGSGWMDISNPFLSTKTSMQGQTGGANGAVFLHDQYGGSQDNSSSFDGLTLYCASAINGTINVYGYTN